MVLAFSLFVNVRKNPLLHEDELAANWQLAINGEETFIIEPLR
jgi:hypothetical protein